MVSHFVRLKILWLIKNHTQLPNTLHHSTKVQTALNKIVEHLRIFGLKNLWLSLCLLKGKKHRISWGKFSQMVFRKNILNLNGRMKDKLICRQGSKKEDQEFSKTISIQTLINWGRTFNWKDCKLLGKMRQRNRKFSPLYRIKQPITSNIEVTILTLLNYWNLLKV